MNTDGQRTKIGITYFRDQGNPLKHELFDRIRYWADLVLLDPSRRHPDIPEMGLDLYHMARWSSAAYSDFKLAAEAGISTVNSYAGAKTAEDRVASSRACSEHGISVAKFEYGTADEITLEPPVVIKSRHELDDDGHEFRLVYSGKLTFEDKQVVQQYIVPSRSFKIFRVGEHTRATEEIPPDGQPEERSVSRRFVELADAVAELFGLALFELDVLVHKTYYVIDVNPVVSLDAVSDALEIYEGLLQSAVGVSGSGFAFPRNQ